MYMGSERKQTFPACVEGRRPASTLLKRTGSGFYHSARIQSRQVQEVYTLRSEVMFYVDCCFKSLNIRRIFQHYIFGATLSASAIKFKMYLVCHVHVKLKTLNTGVLIKFIYWNSVSVAVAMFVVAKRINDPLNFLVFS